LREKAYKRKGETAGEKKETEGNSSSMLRFIWARGRRKGATTSVYLKKKKPQEEEKKKDWERIARVTILLSLEEKKKKP